MKVVAVFLLLIVCFAARGQATPVSPKPASPLLLRANVDRHVFHMKDSFTVEASLLNISGSYVYLYTWDLCWNFADALRIQVLDAKGTPVQGSMLVDCVPPPPMPGNVYEFVRLDAGNFYGTSARFKVSDLIPKPGNYTLTVAFHRTLQSDWVKKYLPDDPIAKEKLWSDDEPVLHASPIKLLILP
jgi:hypothetical protein